ncbi:unnamed protein product [Prunus brigantina]
MNISAESNPHCFAAQPQRSFLENDNSIVFTDEDMEIPYPDHRRPLYLEGQINDVFIRRALVDTGSSVNILPLSVLTAAGIPLSKIVQSQTSISGFGNQSEVTVGYMQVNLKVGPIRSLTKFYVVDVDVAYHALLGRPWLNKHKLVVSTYHQCVKGRIGLRPIRIPGNQAPFNKDEAHYSEAEFYTECTEPMTAPKHMQDGSTAVAEQLETINLDVFAWSYEEMPGLNPNLVSHTLNIELGTKPVDAEKTAFRTPYGNFYYTVMPFGLKNAGATYQRAMTAVFHDMMGKEVEDYVDDLVCGIDVDSEKTKAICSLAPPKSPKELKSFMGRLSYIRRFIPGLAAMMSVFTPLLKKGKPYIWSQECQEAYQQVQQLITKLPTMRAPEVLGELPEMVATVTKEEPWTLYFDGSSTSKGGGAGVVLINPNGQATALSFKLDFPCTNNVAEYEAFIMGLSTAREMGAEKMKMIGDSNLVLSQLQGSFAVKEATLAPYRTAAERLINSFKQVAMEHIPGITNRYADALATLGSKLSFVQEQPNITVIKRSTPVIEAMAQEDLLEDNDWRKPLKKKLGDESSIKDLKDYVIIFGELYRRLPGGVLTRCVGTAEARRRLQEVHDATCSLEPIISLYRRLQRKGYYWPEMKKQAAELQSNYMRTPWPFHTWGLDLIGTIHPPSDGYIWILTATEYFTKWVEAIPLRKATGAAVSNFIREYIVCRFGIPYKMVTDNGTPFVNRQVSSTLSGYGIKHRRSTPYYPQGNGQAEATNKTILRILSKMVYEYQGSWSVHLPDALWAYRTSPRSATGFSPYSLVYGSEAISPVEITIPTARVAAVNDLEWDAKTCSDWRLLDLEAADERRMEAERRMALYHKTVAQAYNRTVKPQAFKQGDLVLKVVEHVRRQVSGPSKFAPQWEGPLAVKEVHSSGYYRLISVKEGTLTDPINGKWLKPYYC